MIRKITQVAYTVGQIKNLKTTATSLPKGLKVTYPNVENKTHDIESPLQTFISSLAACQTATLRAVATKAKVKLGTITFSRIESNYNLAHWTTGGKDNKINDIFIEAEIETDVENEQLQKLIKTTENLCPIYQIISGSGIQINSVWKNKKIL